MKRGTRRALITVLNQILKLLHPLMPFITEEIWVRTGKLSSEDGESIMLSQYPQTEPKLINETIEAEIEWLKSIIQSVRTIRSEMAVSPAKMVPLVLRFATEEQKEQISKYETTLKALSRLSSIECLADDATVPLSATAVVGELELLIPMAGIIDKEAELSRLAREVLKFEKDIAQSQNKLNNPQFAENAPEEVIKKEQERLAQAQLSREKLLAHQETIAAL
jgi:valyl-tRNA synthetase